MRAAALVAVVLLAGCAAPAGDAPPSSAAGPFTRALDPPVCDVVEAIGLVPGAKAQEVLPRPFVAVTDGSGMTRVIWGAVRCADGARAYVAVQAEPDDPALAAEGVARSFFEPEHAADAPETFAQFPAFPGPVLASLDVAVGASGARASVETSEWRHEAEAPVVPMSSVGARRAFTGVFREWFAVEGGYGFVQAQFGGNDATREGAGPVRLLAGEGSPTRDLLGEDATLPGIVFEGIKYDGMTVGFVPWPDDGA